MKMEVKDYKEKAKINNSDARLLEKIVKVLIGSKEFEYEDLIGLSIGNHKIRCIKTRDE